MTHKSKSSGFRSGLEGEKKSAGNKSAKFLSELLHLFRLVGHEGILDPHILAPLGNQLAMRAKDGSTEPCSTLYSQAR